MTHKGYWAIALLTLAGVVVAACGPFGAGPSGKTVYIGPYQVDCVGVAPQKCLLVKEKPADDWTYYYDQIQGFEYEPGYEYELRIMEERIENPPADASSLRWTLVEVVAKTRSLEGTTWVMEAYLNSEGVLASALSGSEATARFEDGNVGGNASCNSYFGTYRFHGDNKLSVDIGGMTEMYCAPEELMAQEGEFLAALDKAASYVIAENKLQIEDVSGKEILVFSALEPMPLVGTTWQLTGYNNGVGGFASVLAGSEVTAVFAEDGKLGGSAGCNNYAASFEISGDRISIGPVAATMMMCPEPDGIMDQEGAYLSALEAASTYAVEGKQLSLFDSQGQVLLGFTVREPTSLVGTEWQVIGYNNGSQAVVSVIIGTEMTATFGEDGSMTGTAGCNNYIASYELEGDAISIGPAATTRMFCGEPEGIMEQETQYLAALETAATYRIDGDRLQLRTADGALVADYVLKPRAAGLDEETLANIEYKSDWTQSGVAPLANGEHREQAAPGSATETVVQLTGDVAYGQLDGQDAAAVILVTDPGGSGTFYDLAVVVEQEGQPVNLDTAFLGDRAQINSLSIADNEIVVDMITHGPDDPMCCPTQNVVQTYALEGEELVQTSSQVVGSEDSAGDDLVGVVWKWEKFLESNDNTILVDDPDKYTLEFLVDGTVRVNADCNNGSGSYMVEGNQLTIEVQAMTMAMCPPDSLSDQYIQYLGQVVSYMFDGGKLALALRYDTGIMTFIQ
jgi:heat shock protein HslJ